LLAKIRVDDKVFHEQAITFKELNAGRELSSREYSEVKRAIDELGHKTYVMPKGWRGIAVYPIFQFITIDDNGNINARFNLNLCEHFLDLRKQFAIRLLPEFRQLSGIYAQQLFRFLNSWKNTVEITIRIDELHDFLSTPLSFRKDFKAFRTRVLERAHLEITENTSLEYTWEPIRKGLRKVEAVRFIFDSEKAAAASKEMEEQTQKQKELAAVSELQRLSNQCHKRLKRLNRSCKPRKSEKCNFCTTRGRMYAEKLVRETQGTLLLEDQGSL
jgi:plasmid replication initiation protein